MTDEPKDPKAAGDKPASESASGCTRRTGAAAPACRPAAPAAPVHLSHLLHPLQACAAAEACGPGRSEARRAAAHDTKPAPPSGPTDPPPPAGAEIPAFITALQAAVPGGVTQISFYVGDWTVIVPAAKLLDVGRFLRDTPELDSISAPTSRPATGRPRPQRFDVIYCLFSTRQRERVRVKVRAAEAEPVPSVSGLWPAANWLEREVYDLFGVNFTGHPNRKRILMPDDWQGHPQRKDYPLEGPGELLMENPLDWLKLKQAREEAEIE